MIAVHAMAVVVVVVSVIPAVDIEDASSSPQIVVSAGRRGDTPAKRLGDPPGRQQDQFPTFFVVFYSGRSVHPPSTVGGGIAAAAAVAISIDVATSEKDTPPLRIQAAATAIGRTARHRQTRRNQLMMTTSVRPRRTARSRQLVQIMKIPHVEKAVQGRAVLLVVDVGSGDGAVGGGGAAGPGGVGRATARGGGLGMTAGGGAGSGGCLALHCGCWSQCVRVFERVRNSKQCLHSMRSSVFRRGCRGGFSSGWDG
mmetsp:Transcript_15247/g.32349  ORF Transcript_15247/g.32349 Transcript_15247/m.32349 type:complete len:255 (-) Transcript_15247:149-913(-)